MSKKILKVLTLLVTSKYSQQEQNSERDCSRNDDKHEGQ